MAMCTTVTVTDALGARLMTLLLWSGPNTTTAVLTLNPGLR
jgi:hypothetical protein